MYFTISFLLGLVAVWPLLHFAHQKRLKTVRRLLGQGLVVAALIYIGFAIIWGDLTWIGIETLGVLIYSACYWLSNKFSIVWVGIGWLLHPLWDVFLHLIGPGNHVAPEWYAIACISFDVAVALYIFWRMSTEANLQISD